MLYIKRINDNENKRTVQHEAGIMLLHSAVKNEYGMEISESDIVRTETGKPFFGKYPDIHFSISHCDGLAVCLVSDGCCGVDAEPLREPRAAVIKRIFSDAETKIFNSLDDSRKSTYFTSLWTLKEACAKADGRGISVMKNMRFDISGADIISNISGLSFQQFFPDNGKYVISCCTRSDRNITPIFDF